MNKALKISTIIAGILATIIIAAIIIVPLVFDPNDYKPQITEAVEKATGRDFQIKGDIELSVFPWIGVNTSDISLGNAPGFGEAPMLSVGEASVKVKLLPLLSKTVIVDTLALDGLEANLARNSKGKTNWEDLIAGQSEKQPSGEKKTEAPRTEEKLPIRELLVTGLTISDAHVIWDDQMNNVRQEVRDLNLALKDVALDRDFPLSLSVTILSDNPAGEIALTLKTRILPEIAKTQVTLSSFDTKLDIKKLAIDTPQKGDAISGPITIACAKLMANWGQGLVTANNLDLKTDLAGNVFPGDKGQAGITGNLTLNWLKQTLSLADLNMAAYDVMVTATADCSKLFTAPQAQGNLTVAEFSPKKLMQTLGIEPPKTTDESVLQKSSLNLNFTATPNAANTGLFRLMLDDTTFSGNAAVSNFKKPAIRFDVSADAIDVDRYLPPKEEKKKTPPPAPKKEKTAKPSGKEKEIIPVDMLRTLNVDGSINVGSLKAFNVRASDLLIKVKAKDGKVNVDPLSAILYGGRYSSALSTDVSGQTPKSSVDLKLSQLSLAPLLGDVTGKTPAGGTTDLSLAVAAKGATLMSMLKTLNGQGDFKLSDGYVKGFALDPSRFSKTKGYTASKDPAQEQTKFRDVSARFTFRNGTASTKDLKLETGQYSIKGQGGADLAAQELDFDLDADLKAFSLPISVGGTFSDPKFTVSAQKVLEKSVEGLEKTIEDTGKGIIKAPEGLMKLFNGGKK